MTAPEDTAEVTTTARVFYAGHVAVPGTVLAAIPTSVAEVLVAAGAAELYTG